MTHCSHNTGSYLFKKLIKGLFIIWNLPKFFTSTFSHIWTLEEETYLLHQQIVIQFIKGHIHISQGARSFFCDKLILEMAISNKIRTAGRMFGLDFFLNLLISGQKTRRAQNCVNKSSILLLQFPLSLFLVFSACFPVLNRP